MLTKNKFGILSGVLLLTNLATLFYFSGFQSESTITGSTNSYSSKSQNQPILTHIQTNGSQSNTGTNTIRDRGGFEEPTAQNQRAVQQKTAPASQDAAIAAAMLSPKTNDQVALYRSLTDIMLHRVQGLLFAQLGLAENDQGKFEQLLIDRSTVSSELQAAAAAAGMQLTPTEMRKATGAEVARIDNDIATLLGPEANAKYQDWNNNISAYGKAQEYAQRVVFEADPMTSQQIFALAQILKGSSDGLDAEMFRSKLQGVVNSNQAIVLMKCLNQDKITGEILKKIRMQKTIQQGN
jgi:hypothetical protein